MTYLPGAKVLLVVCPHGEPGVVVGWKRGKVQVLWADLGFTGKHSPELLQLIPSSAEQVNHAHA